MAKLRILCLHGFGTNAKFMQMQTKAFRKVLQAYADFVFVDAPFIVPSSLVADQRVVALIQGQHRSWATPKGTQKTTPLQQSLAAFERFKKLMTLDQTPFDGVLGFSQGSAMFHYILGLHSRGLIQWSLLDNIKFYINFSADSWRVRLEDIGYRRFQIPSLHFLSEEDFVFSKALMSPTLFKNPEIIIHTFGHKFPTLGIRETAIVIRFLKKHGGGRRGIQAQSRL